MKPITIIYHMLLAVLVPSVIVSCNYLDVADNYFSDEISSDSVFNNKRNVEAYMWDITRMFPDEGSLQIKPATLGYYATDEAFSLVETWRGYDGMAYVLGELSPSSLGAMAERYDNCYKAIRRCNTIIKRIDEAKDITATERASILSYVHFFRGYAYYRLLLDFGPGINLGDEVLETNGSSDYYNRYRSTYDDMVEYICNEFEQAALYLPIRQSVMNFGRPTRGACYGLIARLRTYWASPEFNGGDAAHRYFGNWKRSYDGAYYVNPRL